jgi:hypothetical protein
MPNEDTTPPTVSITSPTDQQVFQGAPATIAIDVSAVDPGSGVARVVVSIDGVAQPPITQEPYELSEVVLEAGMHDIVANA